MRESALVGLESESELRKAMELRGQEKSKCVIRVKARKFVSRR